MTYGRIGAGQKVFDAIEDIDVDDRDINELQAQIAAILGPQYEYCLSGFNHGSNTAWNGWGFMGPGTGTVIDDEDMWWWQCDENDAKLVMPARLRKGAKVTGLAAIVAGDSNSLGGSIDFHYGVPAVELDMASVDVDDSTTNVFLTSRQDVIKTYAKTGLAIEMGATDTAFFVITGPSNAATYQARLYAAGVQYQMGT